MVIILEKLRAWRMALVSDGQKLTKKLATNSLTNFFKLHQ